MTLTDTLEKRNLRAGRVALMLDHTEPQPLYDWRGHVDKDTGDYVFRANAYIDGREEHLELCYAQVIAESVDEVGLGNMVLRDAANKYKARTGHL